MKLDSVKVFVVGNPPPGYGGPVLRFLEAQDRVRHRGCGRGLCRHLRSARHRLDDRGCVRATILRAATPSRSRRYGASAYGSGFSLRPDLSLMGVVSGLEMACWDIIGKAVEQPVYQLLGGKVHERLRSYTYLYPADGRGRGVLPRRRTARRRAPRNTSQQGFTGLKFDPTGGYSVYDPRQPTQEADRAHRAAGAPGARGRRRSRRIS